MDETDEISRRQLARDDFSDRVLHLPESFNFMDVLAYLSKCLWVYGGASQCDE
tara:strand:+ start:781 stop:939 length:159 start_codon:yes stop_codon:yes gene_type:complete